MLRDLSFGPDLREGTRATQTIRSTCKRSEDVVQPWWRVEGREFLCVVWKVVRGYERIGGNWRKEDEEVDVVDVGRGWDVRIEGRKTETAHQRTLLRKTSRIKDKEESK